MANSADKFFVEIFTLHFLQNVFIPSEMSYSHHLDVLIFMG